MKRVHSCPSSFVLVSVMVGGGKFGRDNAEEVVPERDVKAGQSMDSATIDESKKMQERRAIVTTMEEMRSKGAAMREMCVVCLMQFSFSSLLEMIEIDGSAIFF